MPLLFALVALTFLPGIPLAAILVRQIRDGLGWFSIAGTLGMLWSVFSTLGLTALHLPLTSWVVIPANTLPLLLVLFHPAARLQTRARLHAVSLPASTVLVVLFTTIALAFPLLTIQQGLPTGDVQKSIFWAQRILTTQAFPDYADALAINRDPADFAIPGLHTLTAALVRMSDDPYGSTAWFSLLGALLLAGLAAAFAGQLAGSSVSLPALAFLLVATNSRFLRYTLAPGYHYQNLIGELFLFAGFLFLVHAVGGRGGGRFVGLAAVFAVALPLVHQFSAFVGALALLIIFLSLVVHFRGEIFTMVRRLAPARRRVLLTGGLLAVVALLAALTTSSLPGKLPHLFTASPHLRTYVIPLTSIPALLGTSFTLLGMVGVLVLGLRLWRRELEWRWALLLLWMGVLLALSQGTRAFIDIPSARTLFYLTTPLAISAALGVTSALERLRAAWPRSSPALIPVALALVLAPTAGSALNNGLQSIDHSAQANATLTPATLDLIEWLQQRPPVCTSNMGSRSAPSPVSSGPGATSGHGVPPGGGTSEDRGPHWIPSESSGVPQERSAVSDPRWGSRTAVSRQGGAEDRDTCPNAILIDDWNRRRTTWALLSPYRMLTRVGADLAVIAREAEQSEQRRTQYERLLDFEKIYDLGNSPTIRPLLDRHGIAFVVGASGLSTDVFSHNPALEVAYQNAEVTLFRLKNRSEERLRDEDNATAMLYDRATLANDIGDAEDVFAHLPFSVLAPQISDAHATPERTLREVQSAMSSIGLNIDAYVPGSWDADGNRMVDRAVELSLWALGNGARGRVTRGTTVYATFDLPKDSALHVVRATVPAGDLPIDDQGLAFLTIRLDQGPLQLDLGAARLLPAGVP